MAPDTSPPDGSTRYIQTTRGILSYSQVAPLLAEQVLRVERDIAAGVFATGISFPDLILDFHREIAGDLCPEWAGKWRVRLQNASARMDEMLLETLAFAEGRLLSIHPFSDFNGRVTRLFLREILRRLELPPVDLVPTDRLGEAAYRSALRAGDGLDWHPLMRIWKYRFEEFSESTD